MDFFRLFKFECVVFVFIHDSFKSKYSKQKEHLMNLQSIFGSVEIGKDTTGNFKQSIYGIAVKKGENKFIAR